MKKYKVFRSFGKLDEDVRKHELVAVEYGPDIFTVTDEIIKAVESDAVGIEKYQKGYTALAYTLEPVADVFRVTRYSYVISAVLAPEYGEFNDIIDYGIIEEDAGE